MARVRIGMKVVLIVAAAFCAALVIEEASVRAQDEELPQADSPVNSEDLAPAEPVVPPPPPVVEGESMPTEPPASSADDLPVDESSSLEDEAPSLESGTGSAASAGNESGLGSHAEPGPVTPDDAAPQPQPSEGKVLNRITRTPVPVGDPIFGSYRIRLSVSKPTFNDGLKFYDKLYGDEKLYPTLSADWFAFDWWATFGLSLRAGYYTAEGWAARDVSKPLEQITESDLERDENGRTQLTLIPLQAMLATEFTPFRQKWVVLDGWFGYEWLYYQEVRTSGAGRSTAMASRPSFAGMLAQQTTTTSADDQTLTNKGWKEAIVMGGALNFLLNPLDERTARSMRGSMNLGYVYMSPFVEFVRAAKKEGASFGRSVYGVGFTFETIR